MLSLPSHPAQSFDDAVARIAQLQAQDNDTIHPKSQTQFLSHGHKTPRAILLLHGYTDSVHQYDVLSGLLFAQGSNVFVPRVPHHGYRDRMSDAHSTLTATQLVEWANSVTDMAVGLGDTLTVIGLSMGGVLATWVAEQRADVERVLIVSPAYGAHVLPRNITVPAAQLLKRLPNFFVWWDTALKEKQGFDYSYPRYATRTLANLFVLGSELLQHARVKPPAAREVWMITNANDESVSNILCAEFVTAWRAHSPKQIHTYEYPRALGIPHDIMDVNDPAVKPVSVFPPLLEIVQQEFQPTGA